MQRDQHSSGRGPKFLIIPGNTAVHLPSTKISPSISGLTPSRVYLPVKWDVTSVKRDYSESI